MQPGEIGVGPERGEDAAESLREAGEGGLDGRARGMPGAAQADEDLLDVEVAAAGMVPTPDGVTNIAVVVRAADPANRAQVLGYSLTVSQPSTD